MVYLDCQNLDSALLSFASACRRPAAAIAECVLSYVPEGSDYSPALEAAGLAAMFRSLDVSAVDVSFEGTYYFHGTRVLGPIRFHEEGILPLGQILDRLWDSLHELVVDEVSAKGWRELRNEVEAGGGHHHGWLYSHRSEHLSLQGPYARIARDHHLMPRSDYHDYLAIPEIIEDIASCCDLDLASRYRAAAVPCIVKFRTGAVDVAVLQSAFWYIHSMLHEEVPSRLSYCDYSGDGRPVAPGDVVEVELVGPSR